MTRATTWIDYFALTGTTVKTKLKLLTFFLNALSNSKLTLPINYSIFLSVDRSEIIGKVAFFQT